MTNDDGCRGLSEPSDDDQQQLRLQLEYAGELFGFLPLEFALSLLEKAGVPPLYRLGLGFQWNFLDAERDGFSEMDFAEILRELQLFQKPLDIELEQMEKRSTYQIWRKLRRDLRPVHQYWSEQPKFYT